MRSRLTLKRALGAVPAALAFVKAGSLVDEQLWKPAREKILHVYDLIDETPPSPHVPVEFNVRLAFIEARLQSFEAAIEAAVCALTQLNGRHRYGVDDALYMQQFCIEIIEYCTQELGSGAQGLIPDAVRKRPDLSRLDLRRVSGSFRRYNLTALGPPYGDTGYGL